MHKNGTDIVRSVPFLPYKNIRYTGNYSNNMYGVECR